VAALGLSCRDGKRERKKNPTHELQTASVDQPCQWCLVNGGVYLPLAMNRQQGASRLRIVAAREPFVGAVHQRHTGSLTSKGHREKRFS